MAKPKKARPAVKKAGRSQVKRVAKPRTPPRKAAVSKKVALKKTAAKKPAKKPAAAKKAPVKKAAAKKSAPKPVLPKKSAPKKTAPPRKSAVKPAVKPAPKAAALPKPVIPPVAKVPTGLPPRLPRVAMPIPEPTIVPPKPVEKEPPPVYTYDRAGALKQLADLVKVFERHDWREAFKRASNLPRLYPDFIEGVHKASYISAICRRLLGRPEQPKNADDYELLATEHLNQGDGEGALKLLSAGLKKHAKHAGLWYLEACAQVQTGRHEAALISLKKAIDYDPQNRICAINGKDFAPLKNHAEFIALVKH